MLSTCRGGFLLLSTYGFHEKVSSSHVSLRDCIDYLKTRFANKEPYFHNSEIAHLKSKIPYITMREFDENNHTKRHV